MKACTMPILRRLPVEYERGEEPQQLAAAHLRVQREVGGHVADPSQDRQRFPTVVEAEDLGAAAGRAQQAEQRADRRALSGAVRPEEPEHLSGPDREVEVENPGRLAVVLRQPVGTNRLGHREAL
jgi:hypothetical protein